YNYLWRVQKLELGELELTNLPVIFAELPNQLKTALIGKDLLDKFLITINYPEGDLILIPKGNHDLKTNIFSTGLALRKDKHNKTYVRGFWEDSPADNNSLQPADEIYAINNVETAELSIKEINAILENEQIHSIELKIKDGDNIRETVLNKKMLFP
ncbi:MAG: PDZ domain-containing protein, partial [Candidatus Neomarinimicrobiota bacterium]